LSLDIIDTHGHLDMTEFADDREEVIRRAHEAGVNTMITIGINLESNIRAICLAEKYPNVYAGVGIHPQDSQGITPKEVDQLIEMAKHPRVVAIGELGLDFFREHSPRADQLKVLGWQLEAAKIIGKPIVIHCRQAQDEFLTILKDWCAGRLWNAKQVRVALDVVFRLIPPVSAVNHTRKRKGDNRVRCAGVPRAASPKPVTATVFLPNFRASDGESRMTVMVMAVPSILMML